MFLYPHIKEIKLRREAAGLTKQALSRKAGLPDNAILRIENGTSARINHLRANAIAKALECKVEDICTAPERSA